MQGHSHGVQRTSPTPSCRRAAPLRPTRHRHVENVSGQRQRWLEEAKESHPADIQRLEGETPPQPPPKSLGGRTVTFQEPRG